MSDTSEQTPEARPFRFTGRIRSFQHAIRGVFRMIQCQHNAWIHAISHSPCCLRWFSLSHLVHGLVLDRPGHLDRLDG